MAIITEYIPMHNNEPSSNLINNNNNNIGGGAGYRHSRLLVKRVTGIDLTNVVPRSLSR